MSKPLTTETEWMIISDAAEHCNYSVGAIRKLIQKGHIAFRSERRFLSPNLGTRDVIVVNVCEIKQWQQRIRYRPFMKVKRVILEKWVMDHIEELRTSQPGDGAKFYKQCILDTGLDIHSSYFHKITGRQGIRFASTDADRIRELLADCSELLVCTGKEGVTIIREMLGIEYKEFLFRELRARYLKEIIHD